MTGEEDRPWTRLYPPDLSPAAAAQHDSVLEAFRAAVRRAPDAPAILYFDTTITYGELDVLSDAFAAELLDDGFAHGDRVALCLQNGPQFVLCLLGTWKAGGIAVPVNPMYREREIEHLLWDSGARVLVCL